MATRKKAEKAGPETRTIEYLAPGVAPSGKREDPSLDPALEEIRDREVESNKVDISGSREEPSIDPELVKARDEEIKRQSGKQAKAEPAAAPSETSEPARKTASSKKSSK